jgi:hypothetical protein
MEIYVAIMLRALGYSLDAELVSIEEFLVVFQFHDGGALLYLEQLLGEISSAVLAMDIDLAYTVEPCIAKRELDPLHALEYGAGCVLMGGEIMYDALVTQCKVHEEVVVEIEQDELPALLLACGGLDAEKMPFELFISTPVPVCQLRDGFHTRCQIDVMYSLHTITIHHIGEFTSSR